MPRGIGPNARYDEARLQRRLWTPEYLTGKILWLDAADRSTITTTTTGVSQWSDKSGNGLHVTQGTAANQPAFVENGINGLPAISFDGVNDGLQTTANAALYSYPISVFVVFSLNALSSAYNALFDFYCANSNVNAGYTALIKSNATSAIYATTGSYASYDGTGSATYAIGEPTLFSCDIQNNYLAGYKNTVLDGSVSSTFTLNQIIAANAVTVGASYLYSRFNAMMESEILIVPAPTLIQRSLIDGYLMHKWRMRDALPATHRFKNSPPLLGM